MQALLIIDVQNDFLSGGALAIPRADEVIPVINELMPQFDVILATQDWHPPNHVSFAATHQKSVGETLQIEGVEQVLWPVHCVQNTKGADFPKTLHTDSIDEVFRKGTDPKIDSYSAFFDNARRRSTGLAAYLQKCRISQLFFTGLATDYCVLYSVLDALSLGFSATVFRKACRAIRDEEKAFNQMRHKGVVIK